MIRKSSYSFLIFLVLLSCSDESSEEEQYLYFEYNGNVVDLRWTWSNNLNQLLVDFERSTEDTTYYREGYFLFGAGGWQANNEDIYQVGFTNPAYIDGAPCFIITIKNDSNSCGHLLSEGLAGLCLNYEGYVDKDLSTCDVKNESLFNSNLFDQNQVFTLVEGSVQVFYSNCYTFEHCGLLTGCHEQTNCDVEGTFSATYSNPNGQTISITNGKYKLIAG